MATQPPELTWEAFTVLARQVGFDPADPHLEELFPDVQLVFSRAAAMFEEDLTGLEPSSAHPPTPPWLPEQGA